MAELPDIAIVGPGKVGTALGVLAMRAGLRVCAVGGGRRCSAQQAARVIGSATRALSAEEAAASGLLVLLCVPDDAIANVCSQLVTTNALKPGTVLAHCCGALSSKILAPARAIGCHVGSMHPLQTFPTAEAAIERMAGTRFFIEGDAQAVEMLEKFAVAVGGIAHRTTPEGKALYHAGAVMASNYLVALLDAAACLTASALQESAYANRTEALRALEPLVRATMENTLNLGPEAALTGPIARGDIATVQRHLAALSASAPELAQAYRAMGRLTVDVATRKGTITPQTAQQILKVLG